MHKYGREFSLAVMENRDGCVSDRVSILLPKLPPFLIPVLVRFKVVRKLNISTPSSELVDAYLIEIAKAYNVKWTPTRKSGQDDSQEGAVKVSPGILVTLLSYMISALPSWLVGVGTPYRDTKECQPIT